MKLFLYLLLLNLLSLFMFSLMKNNFDSSTDKVLNKKEFEKYLKSFYKVRRFFRTIKEDTSESEYSEDYSSSNFQELSDITDHSEEVVSKN